jgi:hypothetical protein
MSKGLANVEAAYDPNRIPCLQQQHVKNEAASWEIALQRNLVVVVEEPSCDS